MRDEILVYFNISVVLIFLSTLLTFNVPWSLGRGSKDSLGVAGHQSERTMEAGRLPPASLTRELALPRASTASRHELFRRRTQRTIASGSGKWREEGREGGRVGERERKKDGWRDGGREGGNEGGMGGKGGWGEGGREEGRKGGREGGREGGRVVEEALVMWGECFQTCVARALTVCLLSDRSTLLPGPIHRRWAGS